MISTIIIDPDAMADEDDIEEPKVEEIGAMIDTSTQELITEKTITGSSIQDITNARWEVVKNLNEKVRNSI